MSVCQGHPDVIEFSIRKFKIDEFIDEKLKFYKRISMISQNVFNNSVMVGPQP